MKNIKEYRIVGRDDYKSVQDGVNKLISKGWQPIGGLAMAEVHYGTVAQTNYSQAMVRYADDEEKATHSFSGKDVYFPNDH